MPAVCPGQSTTHWKFDDIFDLPCIACGRGIEFFKTDVKRKCPHCGEVMLNPRMDFSCAEWCPKAEECLGPMVYGEFMEKKRLEEKSQEHFEALLRTVPPEEEEVAALFARLRNDNPDPARLLDFDRLREIREQNPDLVDRATHYYQEFMRSRVEQSQGA